MADVQSDLGCTRTGASTLTEEDFAAAAASLGCEIAAIKAVTAIEAPRGAFDECGIPTLLFERHLFHKLTSGEFDAIAPDISNAVPGGYGKYSAQYGRLNDAYGLDKDAALRSASWGAFQILGDNHSAAGYPTPDAFVVAMWGSARAQLDAFVAFLWHDAQLRRALQNHAWEDFARVYNGPNYKANGYDSKLAAEYAAAKKAAQ